MSALVTALLDTLRADAGVRAIFGHPARLFDGETERPAYPYAEIASAELAGLESPQTPAGEHRITFAVNVRGGGREEAAAGLAAIIEAIKAETLNVPGMAIVLAHPVYLDIVRGRASQTFRGLLRFRILIEEDTAS